MEIFNQAVNVYSISMAIDDIFKYTRVYMRVSPVLSLYLHKFFREFIV